MVTDDVRTETLRQEAPLVTGIDGAEDGEAIEALSLRAIPAIEAHMPNVDASRERVLDAMENMVRKGLTTLVSLLAFATSATPI